MKPRRYYLSRRSARRHALHFGLVCTLATTIVVNGADILRGGGARTTTPAVTGGTTNTPVPVAPSAGAGSNDTLARTAQAIQAVQAMQNAAHQVANGGSNNLGTNPNNPGQVLPDVPDGLGSRGLQVDPRVGNDPTLWQGANLPTQTTNTGGKIEVTIKQNAQQALLNWETFNVGKNTQLTFDQSAGGSNVGQWIAFNKVNDPTINPSQILGSIKAAGQVYVLNRNGIIFGGSSQVNTHTLVASSLPINDVLVQRGLLNNPDHQFLFDGLDKGPNDTIDPNRKFGDVIVRAGAKIEAPTSAEHVGGRVMLVGPNVINEGTISTPDGQTILAAGLQVGVAAHTGSDPSLRGLDVVIGAVVDPASTLAAYAGTATNRGLINAPRANVTIAGKSVNQLGVIASTTSVSFNGRIDLLGSYDAVANIAYDGTKPLNGPEFLNRSTGNVTFGTNSVTAVLPELTSTEKVTGSQLALNSQVNVFGKQVHFDDGSLLVAPSGDVSVNAGIWYTRPSSDALTAPAYFFMRSGGRIDLDAGAVIDVSGSKNVKSSVTSNIVKVELRGSELANSPLNRDGSLRGQTIYVDITETGTYDGKTWIGTPLADVSGYANLVQRTVGELTISGGTVNLNAGEAVVIRQGASIDVSGGSVNYEGGAVQTSRVVKNGKIFDIAAATPDVKYDGVYTGGNQVYHPDWGILENYTNPIPLSGVRYQAGFSAGGDGGALNIAAPAMMLDGALRGSTYAGERQFALAPANSTLNLSFTAHRTLNAGALAPLEHSPTAPLITFSANPSQEILSDYATDENGVALGLPTSRTSNVVLDSHLLSAEGFGSLAIRNPDGDIVVPESVSLQAGRGGSITLGAANLHLDGSLTAAGGTLAFTTYNLSPAAVDVFKESGSTVLPVANADRGHFSLGEHATLSTAGYVIDDRPGSPTALQTPRVTNGGKISIKSFSADLAAGSVIDVSGGARVAPNGKVSYGNAGSISIATGNDTTLSGVTGGTLSLGSQLLGYSGAKGGSLSIQALAMQIGGTSSRSGTLVLDSSFFNQGGFSSFSLSGIGTTESVGMLVTSGTTIAPQVSSLLISDQTAGQPLTLNRVLQPEGLRSPVSITLGSVGSSDLTGSLVVRADTVIQQGAVIHAGPAGAISVNGGTVNMDGSLIASGGSIKISGATSFPILNTTADKLAPTVSIGSHAVVDTSGSTLLVPDSFGQQRGQVLSGGTISVSGNIVAEAGAVLNVSGAAGMLDLLPGESGRSLAEVIAAASGTSTKPYPINSKPTRVESDAGTITLAGGEMLLTDATLLGNAGGQTAAGGTLSVSSGLKAVGTGLNLIFDPSIVVTNSGTTISETYTPGIGKDLPLDGGGIRGGARFTIDDFERGGFSNLDLGGVVKFSGPVTINAPGRITVGTSPAVYADGTVTLNASRVVLGSPIGLPLTPEQKALFDFKNNNATTTRPATHGAATLNVSANVIDVGYLSLQGIGQANLTADQGDIRGYGTLAIAGDLHLKAAQIYPPTGMDFTLAAYDYTEAGVLKEGSVTIEGSGTKHLPLSAGGSLSVYASNIHQNGVLRAPFGTIRLGWDGTGTPPKDVLTGLNFATTKNLVLGSQSVTSVSAIDPITGKGITIPYGTSLDGKTWIDPSGVNITSGGVPQKSIKLAGTSVVTEQGSQVDIRGGGDLMAYRWVSGLGGSVDILGSGGSFAVIPGYDSAYAPYGAFSNSSTFAGDPGYVNGGLKVGEQVTLQGGGGLPAGVYTLLPARYALLPGAFLVTPQSGAAIGTVPKVDGSSVVSGFQYNGLESGREMPVIATRFEVASSATIAKRAEYAKLMANSFLAPTGGLRLPGDSGQLVLAATQAMAIGGQVLSAAPKDFRGGLIDISSPVDIVIGGAGAVPTAGVLTLDSALLSSFGAESLLIGGYRETTAAGTKVTVTTNNLSLDNAGSSLEGSEVILVSKNNLEIEEGASIRQTGTIASGDTLIFGDTALAGSGNGALVRVGGSNASSIIRRGVTIGTGVTLDVRSGAILKGNGLVLDSTSNTLFAPDAVLDGKSLSISSGRLSLLLDPSVTPGADAGLVLAGSTLSSLSSATSFSLASYSSLDLLGSGSVGTIGANGQPAINSLTLRAAEIRGLQGGGGRVDFTAKTITLDNLSGGALSPATASPSGEIAFHAQSIQLGSGSVAIKGFSQTILDASVGIRTTASGSFGAQGNLDLHTPLVSSEKAVDYSVTAGGALTVSGTGSTGTVAGAGLGSSLSLTGQSVSVASRIVLPSGEIKLHSTGAAGDVTVSGSVEAGGISQAFRDVTKYTDGGDIRLISDHGNVTLTESGVLDVSARPGAGNGGQLVVSAAEGSIGLLGSASGRGGVGGNGGVFVMDTGSLASVAAIDTFLNTAAFDLSRSLRVRNGNVLVDGVARAHSYVLSADRGSITVSGTIDASGSTGGSVKLVASDDLVLLDGSIINASGTNFDSAGKGGSVLLETRGNQGGGIAIRNGSLINLGVTAATASSAAAGQFQGTLHLRAPRNAANNDLAVSSIDGEIRNASNILVEGYKTYDVIDYGGIITSSVQAEILSSGQSFMGASGTTTGNYTAMMDRLLVNNRGLASTLVLAPGAEIINSATPGTVNLSLNAAGGTVVVPSTGGNVLFPSGTPGNSRITSTAAGTITSANGVVTTFVANTQLTLEAGSTLTLTGSGTISYAAGTAGPIAVTLASGSAFNTSASNSVASVTTRGTSVSLNTAGTSGISLAAGAQVTFPTGTVGSNRIRATVAGTITSATGVVTNFAANANTLVPAGSTVSLTGAGTITFATGGTGGAIPVALAAGSFSTVGATTVTPNTGNIILGTAISTAADDWNLAGYRFGPKGAAGVLTLRSSGNLVFNNALSDGFTSSSYRAGLLARNELLPDNLQTWSYRLVAGADYGAADVMQVRDLAGLPASTGSLLLGKNAFEAIASGGVNALTSSLLAPATGSSYYQVIRTGSGDIDVAAGRDIRFLNQFATIYTAGTLVADPTLGGTFDTPVPNMAGSGVGSLGAIQQTPGYAAQFTMAGGDLNLYAGNDIIHLTQNALGQLIDDSSRQMPVNWLYRRGYVDPATGEFGASKYGEAASTAWWVDFSNFFEGVGALGGGNVTLTAGRDVKNVDASVVTNARMPKGKPDATKLVELGGGDLAVRAGRNIDGGVYYVERGNGTLDASGSITTNATRSPSLGGLRNPADVLEPTSWLGTTLFLGKGSFDVSAGGDALLGPVANLFLLPQGYNNTYWYKTWFSTYGQNSSVSVSSLGGSVDLREGLAIGASGGASLQPALQAWFENVLLLKSGSAVSASFYQPWLRLAESAANQFTTGYSLMPGSLSVTTFSGDIGLVGNLTLSPSKTGNLSLFSSGTIDGFQVAGSKVTNFWSASRINLSDADPASIPGIGNPFAYQTLVGTSSGANRTNIGFLAALDALFDETGSSDGNLQKKQTLHAAGVLHAGDTEPVRIYSGGDVSGITLYSGKSARILAGRDLRDISFYLQNIAASDLSVVSAGRDLIAYDANTAGRITARSSGNLLAGGQGPQAGDIQISGPGTLEVFAGRNLDLGIGSNNPDGTGVGITSIGNGRNPYLPFGGADIIAGAGIGTAGSLDTSRMDFTTFINQFVKANEGPVLLKEAGFTLEQFNALDGESQKQVALEIFYYVLRDSGRSHNNPDSEGFGTYDRGQEAIKVLFPGTDWEGNMTTQGRDIRTRSGGDITLLAPGGSLALAASVIGNPLAPPGIVTEAGGDIHVFTRNDVNLGISRIFTLRGGNEIIWSSLGNIAAGSSSKTVQSAPPTRVLIDPQSGDVKTDLAGLATGGGIGVLTSVAGVEPGDVDLIAPVGTVDAGDAGIRVSGNLNIAAAVVVNAGNISVGGSSAGTPSVSVGAPSLGSLTAASTAAAAAGATASESPAKTTEAVQPTIEAASVISAEVIGYGGGDDEEDEKDREKNGQSEETPKSE